MQTYRDELTSPALSPNETARRLGVSRETVYRLMDSGAIPSFKVGSVRRVRAEDLHEWINDQIGVDDG